ncbi:hypothetical protein PG993_000163 [Apiospora rasikravindrae]|uniref:DUF7580 domain-containing protein n=1 Tax=Apiospora rasikravindrae TaxID=990691 RepID=A0ABR1U9U6_9PEZI
MEVAGLAKDSTLLAQRHRQLRVEQLKLKKSLMSLSPDLDEEEINESLIRHFPDDYKIIVGTIEDLRQCIWKLREQLGIDPEGKPLSSSRVRDEWRRVKQSFKKKETVELFNEIDRYNNNLRICFEGKREISSDLGSTQSSGQGDSFNKRVCQRLRSDACLIHDALSEAYDRDCANVHLNMIDLSWHHQGLRTSQLPDLCFPDRDSCAQAPHHWYTAKIRLEPMKADPPVESAEVSTKTLTVATASDRKPHRARFSVSFRRSSRSPSPMPIEPAKQPPTTTPPRREHIHSICSHPATKLFGGYLMNSDPDNQNMVILERKQPAAKHAYVLGWRSFLTPGAASLGRSRIRRKKMSNKDRLAIASAATWAVLLLCGTPWLEETKMIENDIVLLAEETLATGRTPLDLDNANAVPAFSYRFSKPQVKERSPTPQQDPGPLGGNAIPHRTLFALAILLLEIGLDTEFRNIYEEFTESEFRGFEEPASLLESYWAAEEAAEDLYDAMGDKYADAVKRCLKFNFNGRKSLQRFDNEMLRQQFFAGVVAPVQERYEQEQTRHRVFRAC